MASAEELDAAFAKLAEGGKVLMPLDNYGFSRRFGWCNDRFGVSWQLNLPETSSRRPARRDDQPVQWTVGGMKRTVAQQQIANRLGES